MYENQANSMPDHAPRAEHAPRAPISGDRATPRTDSRTDPKTDPKFVRESNTMRKMLPWQIAALAIFAAAVVGLAVFYFVL